MGWSCLLRSETLNLPEAESVILPNSPMNIIFWNCRGALNPRFHSVLSDLLDRHSPEIVVVTETRVGGERAKTITDRLPFDGALHADTIGYSGGIWVLWKSDVVEVTQLAKTEQEIHVTVKVLDSNLTWILSSIYASPRLAERKLLWNNLTSIASMHQLPWLMVGDFNELLSCNDKQGGNPLNSRRVQLFKDCLDNCGMVDLGFHGPQFTWVNKRESGHYIQERLDRAFANCDWRGLYPEASVNHLARTHSDHCPVLLSLEAPSGTRLIRPFRFQPMWLSHPAFPEFVTTTWAEDLSLKPNVEKFTRDVISWNKEVFGNIFHKKNRVVARLCGVQSNIANRPSEALLRFENQLQREFLDILKQEEEFWSVKSRYNWLIQGDRNTKFFHISTLIRRKRNKISSLQDNQGNWVHDH